MKIVIGELARNVEGFSYLTAGAASETVVFIADRLRHLLPEAHVAHQVGQIAGRVFRPLPAQAQKVFQPISLHLYTAGAETQSRGHVGRQPEWTAAAPVQRQGGDGLAVSGSPARLYAPTREIGESARDQHANIVLAREAEPQGGGGHRAVAKMVGMPETGQQPNGLTAGGFALDSVGRG